MNVAEHEWNVTLNIQHIKLLAGFLFVKETFIQEALR